MFGDAESDGAGTAARITRFENWLRVRVRVSSWRSSSAGPRAAGHRGRNRDLARRRNAVERIDAALPRPA
jgi:hypothetical protein